MCIKKLRLRSFSYSRSTNFKMLRFMCLLFFAAAVSAANMPKLYSKYSMTGIPEKDCFYKVPQNIIEAVAAGWVIPPETKNTSAYTEKYCKPDDAKIGTICVILDNMGSIAGYQISIPVEVDQEHIPGFDYVEKGFKKQIMFNNTWYSNEIYFVSQEVIRNGGREFNNQTGTGLWLQVGDELLETPLHETSMDATPNLFHKQNCFIRMGQHYFWDVRKDLTPEEFMPWFLLYNNEGELTGFGFIAFGSKVEADYYEKNSWIENVPAPAIMAIAPDVPDWVMTYIAKYGIMSHHVYFQENPWDLTCPKRAPTTTSPIDVVEQPIPSASGSQEESSETVSGQEESAPNTGTPQENKKKSIFERIKDFFKRKSASS